MLKPMTYDDVAKLYDQRNRGSRPARTLRLDTVATWFEGQPDCVVDDDDNLCLDTSYDPAMNPPIPD